MQDYNDDDTNQEGEYDDSEEVEEEEESPYANSDPEEEAVNLKNGHILDSSLSSPEK
jgi:hypothetical protein